MNNSSPANKFFFLSIPDMSLSVSVGKYSIHSAEAVAFVRKLEPEEIVLSIMEEGLKFDFLEALSPYFEKNNCFCLENLEVV